MTSNLKSVALILYVDNASQSLKAPMSKMKRTHGHEMAPIDEHVRFAHARKNFQTFGGWIYEYTNFIIIQFLDIFEQVVSIGTLFST